jgi:hypothetical protein
MRGQERCAVLSRLKTLFPTLIVLTPMPALAANPPRLSTGIARNANDLQRAVWACEAGAQSFAPTRKSGGSRFFLGVVDHSAGLNNQSPLMLSSGHLSGLGQVSTGQGWFNIRFTCGLAPAFDQAKSFTYKIVSPVKANSSTPSDAAKATGSDQMTWHVDGANPLVLVHGIKETDDRDFVARCTAKSGTIEIHLTRTVPWIRPDDYVTVSMVTGGKSFLYVARGMMDDNLGAAMPVFSLRIDDGLMTSIAATGEILINIGAETAYSVPLRGSTGSVTSFTKACR